MKQVYSIFNICIITKTELCVCVCVGGGGG